MSPEAVEDIESIAAYIERDSKYYARAVVSRIVTVSESIPDHPRLGRIVPEINDPVEPQMPIFPMKLNSKFRAEFKLEFRTNIVNNFRTRYSLRCGQGKA